MTDPRTAALPPPDAVNHWENLGGIRRAFGCSRSPEYCSECGREMVEHFEITGRHSRKTGQRTYERLHSCPSWITGWRASRWARGWACPGMNHDSHDADNPLSARGYR